MDREFLAEYERQGRPEVFLGMGISKRRNTGLLFLRTLYRI